MNDAAPHPCSRDRRNGRFRIAPAAAYCRPLPAITETQRPWPQIDVIDAADIEQLNTLYFTTLRYYATTTDLGMETAAPRAVTS